MNLAPETLTTWAAAAGALIYLYRIARGLFRRLDAMDRLLARELTHNHGSSMKDDLHGIAVAMGELQRRVDDLEAHHRPNGRKPS